MIANNKKGLRVYRKSFGERINEINEINEIWNRLSYSM
jgi:hypothetical protein